MTEKLFFSQELINSWTDDEKVKFENDTLSIATPKGEQQYHLTPAYRFLKVSDGSEDPHALIGTVATGEDLEARNADVYLNSCLIGEIPYDVEPGYVAVKAEDERSIEEMLMEYLAKTLI